MRLWTNGQFFLFCVDRCGNCGRVNPFNDHEKSEKIAMRNLQVAELQILQRIRDLSLSLRSTRGRQATAVLQGL